MVRNNIRTVSVCFNLAKKKETAFDLGENYFSGTVDVSKLQ